MREINNLSPYAGGNFNKTKNDFGVNKEIAEEELTEDENVCGSKHDNYERHGNHEGHCKHEKHEKHDKDDKLKKINLILRKDENIILNSNIDIFETVPKLNKKFSHNFTNFSNQYETKFNFQRDSKRNNLIDKSDFSPRATQRKSQRKSQISKYNIS